MNVKSLFIVWAHHSRRAETLATELNGQVSFQYEARLKGGRLTPLRYLVQGWKTWHLLEREQPEVVLVQSPPIFAPLVVALWCELRGKTYAIDCHTSTFHNPKWSWALPMLRLLSKRASAILCPDVGAQNITRTWKVRSFFLADGIPTLSSPTGTIGTEGETRIGVIGSLDSDEPTAEVFAAASLLRQVTFYVAGDPKRLKAELLAHKPENVILTGFLRGGTYTALLKNVHGLVVLTNQSKALNCAAFEAVAMAKPTVVSDWPEMRCYFTRGFIYVNNTPDAIAAGVKKALDEQVTLIPEVIAMRPELAARWQTTFEEFAALLLEPRRQAIGKDFLLERES